MRITTTASSKGGCIAPVLGTEVRRSHTETRGPLNTRGSQSGDPRAAGVVWEGQRLTRPSPWAPVEAVTFTLSRVPSQQCPSRAAVKTSLCANNENLGH